MYSAPDMVDLPSALADRSPLRGALAGVLIALQSVEHKQLFRSRALRADTKKPARGGLFLYLYGAPGMVRTCDPLIRSQVYFLYFT